MEHNVDDLKEILKSHNIKPSTIRIKILDLLKKENSHPTALNIYDQLIDDIPTLSKTSVYNTLDVFLENGLIQSVSLHENEARFDIITEKHGHFKCTKCNLVYDFKLNGNMYKELEDFIIMDEDIQLYGLCNNCK